MVCYAPIRRLRILLPLFLISCICFGQKIEYKAVDNKVLEERLRLAHRDIGERYRRLRALFEQTGCSGGDLIEQKVKRSKEPNLICQIGESPNGDAESVPKKRIIVGAHFDAAGGDGVIDNWTGAILLPSLAEFVREKPRRHTFHFVGFAAEEKGLLGSQAYLKSLSKAERQQIAAVVTMDSLGLSATKWWPNSSDRDLAVLAALVARAMNLSFVGLNVDRIGTTDSATFHDAGIPVLSLHSITQGAYHLINSPHDVWKSLSWQDYYDTHRFVSALLIYLDEKLP